MTRPGTRAAGAPSDKSPMLPAPVASLIRAVLLDLDGTLYHQAPLRWRMLLELGLSPLTSGPRAAARTLRHLRTFRHVREELRELGCPAEPLEELQYSETAKRLGDEAQAVRETVLEWMHRRPLRHLPPHRRADLPAFLDAQRERGLELGVFSDYPAPDKLEALGIADRFSLTLCATDPAINAFKPHPRGFERACELWNLSPSRCSTWATATRWTAPAHGRRACPLWFWVRSRVPTRRLQAWRR